jgi:hypothetical protein
MQDCSVVLNFLFGLNTYLPIVLYDLYFLSSQFYFLSNLIPMVHEKTEMVPPSNFPSRYVIL